MSRHHNARGRWTGIAGLLLAGGIGLLLSGCSTRNDPHFNPYARCGGEPTVLDRVEHAVEVVETALDNLDERQENTIY
ncbi:MAG: hypothetical protein PVJ57_21910 [Phycisphaerae bacterium]|jgi:hypothetical protein